jgi:hypothetical protein
MKTTTCLFFLILTQGLFAQIPSINEHNLLTSMKSQKTFNEIDSLKEVLNSFKTNIKVDPSTPFLGSEIGENDVKELKEKIEELKRKLNINGIIFIEKKDFYEKEEDSINAIIKELGLKYKGNDDLNKLLREIKQKKNQILKNKIKRKNDSIHLVNGYNVLFPSWKIYARDDFFESHYGNTLTNTGFVNSIGLNFNDSGSTMQSELVTDNLGPLRIAFGTVVSTTKTEDSNEETIEVSNEEDAYKRLINGGGNFYLETVLPFLTYSQSSITLYSFFNLKGAMDIKSFGNNIDTSTGNGTFGNTTYIGINSDSKKFNFFIQGNLNYSFGSNAFYENLGLKNEKAFVNGKLIFGLTLDQKIRFTAITNSFGSDPKIRSGKLMFGVQFLPDISK